MKARILFTGGGGAGSSALAELLDDKYEVFFADANVNAKPFGIRESRWVHIPVADSPNFIAQINSICNNLHINLLIPGVDEELVVISQNMRELGFRILLPPVDFISRHLDKLESNDFIVNAGLRAPQTVSLGKGDVDFPCIIKPRIGRGSRHVAVVSNEKEVEAHVLLSGQLSEHFILQERVVGQEFTVMMVATQSGVLRAVVPVLVECKKGITLRGETYYDEKVIALCRAVHAADPVSGCYNIQLIKTDEGSIMPFEINPRISTTTCLGVAAGVDFINIFFDQNDYSEMLKDGLVAFQNRLSLKRSWNNEFI